MLYHVTTLYIYIYREREREGDRYTYAEPPPPSPGAASSGRGSPGPSAASCPGCPPAARSRPPLHYITWYDIILHYVML